MGFLSNTRAVFIGKLLYSGPIFLRTNDVIALLSKFEIKEFSKSSGAQECILLNQT